MKWCLVILFTLLCCTAQKHKLTTVKLPTAENIVNNSNSNTRIVGGAPTTIERFPYTVQVNYLSRLACGGSLLTRRHVLSAAHCFFDMNGNPVSPMRYSVRVGSTYLGSGGKVHSVSAVIVHERYNIPIRDNDVAVMLLSSTVAISVSIGSARIPEQGQEVPDNSVVTHVGWGLTDPNTNTPASVLQEVTIRTIGFQTCSDRYTWLTSMRPGEEYIITHNMICSGLLDIGGADACQGDSGGPLIYQGIVVGVTSWGYGCGDPRFPGVNANVSAFTNWINQTVTRYNAAPLVTRTSSLLIMISLVTAIIAS